MNRIDVHCHFLPALDDGCRTVRESIECIRQMIDAGYSRIFCTPHCGTADFSNLTAGEIAERVRNLQGHITAAGLAMEIKPGGEIRLSPNLESMLPQNAAYRVGRGELAIPSFGNAGKYVLVDSWEEDWPAWAAQSIQWLQSQGCQVIVAHPERMAPLIADPNRIDEIAQLGVLFQGNLGPIGGSDNEYVVALAERYLQENRYFMVGSDGHRSHTLQQRLLGLNRILELVGEEKLHELTIKNPSRIWQ